LKVCWIPFGDYRVPGFWLDLCQNIVLVVPLGFAGIQARVRPTQIVILAALLMTCGEVFQVYCHNRFPSMTDVVNGTAGAVVGVWIGLRWKFDR